MMYELPQALEIAGKSYKIRSDFRAALDIIAALGDPALSNQEKAMVLLQILYPDWEKITDYEEAIRQAMLFIGGGETDGGETQRPVLMNWEQDFRFLVAPINRALGVECRQVEYLHWWTFLSAYMEIGDCTFAQIVSIRSKKAKGKKLEKWEQEYYRENRGVIDIKKRLTESEQAFIENLLNSD